MIDVRNRFTKPEGHATATKAQQIGIAAHHSVTETMDPSATQAEEIAALKAVEDYHINNQQYGLFGYHMAAFPSGRSYLIGNVLGQRAGVAKRNHELTSIVAMGTFTDRLPSQAQLKAVGECIRYTRNVVGKYLPVRGHNLWAVPGWGTLCAGQMNGISERTWDAIAADTPAAVPAALADKTGILTRWGGLANAGFFSDMVIEEGRIQNLWTKSPIEGDINVPADATSVLLSVYVKDGAIDLLDGSGFKAGYCPPGVTTHKVFLDAGERGNVLLRGFDAILDKIEILGYYR